MLIHSRTARLCGRCRHDLLSLFVRGFSTASLEPQSRGPVSLRRPRSRQPGRCFSSNAHRNQSASEPRSQEIPVRDDHNKPTEAQAVQGQLTALQTLEKLLGRKIEDAIEEDQLAASKDDQRLDQDVNEVDLPPRPQAEDAQNPFAALRDSGANVADVAREARQIFGDSLPEGVLNEEEYKIYTRFYGEPDLDIEEELQKTSANELQNAEGVAIDTRETSAGRDLGHQQIGEGVSDAPEAADKYLHFKDQPITTALHDTNLSRAKTVAEALGADYNDDGAEMDFESHENPDDMGHHERAHPLTKLGRFETFPSTVFLPKEAYHEPVNAVMSAYSNKHLKETCEATFGGPGLPDSPLTPRSGRMRQQVPLPLEVTQHSMSPMEANAFMTAVMPPMYAAITSVLVETRKRLGSGWINGLLAKEGGPRVLDVGGAGAGILAWREVVKAHWESLHPSQGRRLPPPPTKSVVLTGSETLRHRAAALLDNTTFIPRLPDYVHVRDIPTLEDDRPAQQRKQFDVIIAPYTIFGLKEDWMRKNHVQNLWSLLNSEGGILILIEKGVPRGFEAIAGARQLLLERHIAAPEGYETAYSVKEDHESIYQKDTGMIIAPCTNHDKCPMYHIPGKSHGRKDWCSFQQRYQRPPHLQRVLGANALRNHDNVEFSYISAMKGKDLRRKQISTWEHLQDSISAPDRSGSSNPPENLSTWTDRCHTGFSSTTTTTSVPSTYPPLHFLPRTVFPPIKRPGHVILDVCTPSARIERWTVSRSQSKQAFRDARKAQQGDLWALGAKTRLPRNLKLGGPGTKEGKMLRGREDRLRDQAERVREEMEEERLNQAAEEEEFGALFGKEDDIEDEDEDMDVDETVRRLTKDDRHSEMGDKIFEELFRTVDEDNGSQSIESQQDVTKMMPDAQNGTRHRSAKPEKGRGLFGGPGRTKRDNWQDSEAEQTLQEWEEEYESDANHGKSQGKNGGVFAKMSKEARRERKRR